MDVFDLFAKISLDTSQYESGLNAAKSMATGAAQIAGGALTAMGAAATAATGALVAGANEVAQYGDNVDKMSQKLGMSAEAYQEWDAIMQHCGTTIDSMQGGMSALSKAAENGSDAFEQLGITQEQIANMSQEELFAATIEGLQQMESGTERNVLAQELLGRSSRELGALLNMTAEDTAEMRDRVHELGGVMSDETVAAAAQFQDNLQDMQTAMDGLKRGITSDLLPSFNLLMEGFTSMLIGEEGGTEAFSEGFSSLLDTISDVSDRAMELIGQIAPVIFDALVQNIPDFFTFGGQILTDIANGILDNSGMILDAAETLIQMFLNGIIDAEGSQGGMRIIEFLNNIADMIVRNIPLFMYAAESIVYQISDGIISAIPVLIPAITTLATDLLTMLTDPVTISNIIQAGVDIVIALADGILDAIPLLVNALPTIIENIVIAIEESVPIILAGMMSLVESIVQEMPNIIDALSSAIPMIIQTIGRAIPTILSSIVGILTRNLPVIMSGVVGMVRSIAQNLPAIITTVVEMLPTIMQEIADALVIALPLIIESIITIVDAIAQELPSIIEMLAVSLPDMITAIVDVLPQLIDIIINTLVELLPVIIDGLVQIMVAIADHLPEIISALVNAMPLIVNAVVNGLQGIIGGVLAIFAALFAQIGNAITEWWTQKKQEIANGWNGFIASVKEWFAQIPYNIGYFLADAFLKVLNFADDLFNWVTIDLPNIIDDLMYWFEGLPDRIKAFFDMIFTNIGSWAKDTWDLITTEVPKIVDNITSFFEELPEKALGWGMDMISNFIDGIGQMAGDAIDAVDEFAQGIADRLGFSEPKTGPLSNFHTYAPDMMDLFAEGIRQNENTVYDQIESSFDFSDKIGGGNMQVGVGGMQFVGNASANMGANQPVTVVLELDKVKLAETVFNLNKDESQRMGVQLAYV